MTYYPDPADQPDRACAERPGALFLFFPQPADVAGIAAAQAICSHCPILSQCAGWTLQEGLTDGVLAATHLDGTHSKGARRHARVRLEVIRDTGCLPRTRRRAVRAAAGEVA